MCIFIVDDCHAIIINYYKLYAILNKFKKIENYLINFNYYCVYKIYLYVFLK